MRGNLLERHLVDVWRQQRLPTVGLLSENGEEVRIIYPGRPGDGAGPDFADAVIECGHRRLTGDVELHISTSQWYDHGHHRDPTYNGVALHVVVRADFPEPTRRQDGRTVPVLVVSRYLRATPRPVGSRPGPNCPGAARHRAPEALGRRLDRSGDERFRAKTARFAADLGHTDPAQVLFQGVMEALGYSRNKAPFLELARRLPVADLATEGVEPIQARLFGAAGLFPSQRMARVPVDETTWRLEALWRAGPPVAPMPSGSWQLLRVRPNNSPLRRMAAMAHLIERYPNLLDGLLGRLPGAPHRGAGMEMESGLLVSGGGYWAEHQDFASPCPANPTLLGRGRAGEIVVNVLLPFAAALGRPQAQAIYGTYHRLAPNSVEAHMADQLGIGPRVVNSARRQQGLLHLYAAFCTRGQCAACRLG